MPKLLRDKPFLAARQKARSDDDDGFEIGRRRRRRCQRSRVRGRQCHRYRTHARRRHETCYVNLTAQNVHERRTRRAPSIEE